MVTGWMRPRIAAAASGSSAAHHGQDWSSQCRSSVSPATPSRIAAMPVACARPGTSPNRIAASSSAKSGARLPKAPATFGPMRRFASKVSKVTEAGNSSPTRAKTMAPRSAKPCRSSSSGASSHSSRVELGTLTSTPRAGGAWRKPNCVSTSPRPKHSEEASASKTGLSGTVASIRERRRRRVPSRRPRRLHAPRAF